MKEYFSYDKNTKLNAVMLLQRRALQKQIDKFQNLLINEENKSTTEVFSEISFPNYLSLRFDINKKIIDDFEMTILGILDSDGRISTSARLQDFLLLMTRITKMDQRALCLYILNERLDTSCGHAFLELGGYRLLKRYIKMAEEEDCVSELKLIINICKHIPFDAIIITETEIGKSINKLLKYRHKKDNNNTIITNNTTNNNTTTPQLHEDIASLQKDVKALKELWKSSVSSEITEKNNKDQHTSNGTAPTTNSSTSTTTGTSTKGSVTLSSETIDLLDGINERLFAQKRHNQQQQQRRNQSYSTTTALPTTSDVSLHDNSIIESKTIIPSDAITQPVTSAIMGSNMKSMFLDAQKNKFIQKSSSSSSSLFTGPQSLQQQDTTAVSIDPLTGIVTVSLSNHDNNNNNSSSINNDDNDHRNSNVRTGNTPSTATATGSSNTLARRTAGVELMVDKAKKLLAAQEISAQLEQSAHTSNNNSSYMNDSMNGMTDNMIIDNNSSHIINELAGISIMESADGEAIGLLSLREINKPLHQYTQLKSALKKKSSSSSSSSSSTIASSTATTTTTAGVVIDITSSPLTTTTTTTTIPITTDTDTSTSTSTTIPAAKRPIKWADVEGGNLKELRTFEVKKLKTGSVATYKSHREMVRKERQLEKSTNISKINEAMQATVPWIRPSQRILSFEMQEYACGAVVSPEAEAQTKRLGHVLEARYIDDSAIPSDPDELISLYDLSTGATGMSGGSGDESGVVVEEIPWLIASGDDSMLTGINNGMTDESDTMYELFQLITRVTGYAVPMHSTSSLSASISAEASQELINSLPECLRGLEIELVLALVQDENNILEILNDNGAVNEWKVARLRQKLHLPPRNNDHYLLLQPPPSSNGYDANNPFNTSNGYGMSTQPQSYQQQQQHMSGAGYNDFNYDYSQGAALAQTQQQQGGQLHMQGGGIGQMQQQQSRPRMSRFSPASATGTSGASAMSGDSGIQQHPWQQQQQQGFGDNNGGVSGGFSQQLQQQQHGSFARQGSGTGMMRGGRGGANGYPQQESTIDTASISIDGSAAATGAGTGSKLKRKFPTSKGNVPCKFFNTAKGCQFGEKCSFAHIASEGSISTGSSGSSGGYARGSSSGMNANGTGSRHQQQRGSGGGGSGSSSGGGYQQRNTNLSSPKKSRYAPNRNSSNSNDSIDDSTFDTTGTSTTAAASININSSLSAAVDAFGRDMV